MSPEAGTISAHCRHIVRSSARAARPKPLTFYTEKNGTTVTSAAENCGFFLRFFVVKINARRAYTLKRTKGKSRSVLRSIKTVEQWFCKLLAYAGFYDETSSVHFSFLTFILFFSILFLTSLPFVCPFLFDASLFSEPYLVCCCCWSAQCLQTNILHSNVYSDIIELRWNL